MDKKPLTSMITIYSTNDIFNNINSTIRLYAEDVLIYRVIESDSDCQILQNDLNKPENWADLWSMKFNSTKCVHLAITNKKTFLKEGK